MQLTPVSSNPSLFGTPYQYLMIFGHAGAMSTHRRSFSGTMALAVCMCTDGCMQSHLLVQQTFQEIHLSICDLFITSAHLMLVCCCAGYLSDLLAACHTWCMTLMLVYQLQALSSLPSIKRWI